MKWHFKKTTVIRDRCKYQPKIGFSIPLTIGFGITVFNHIQAIKLTNVKGVEIFIGNSCYIFYKETKLSKEEKKKKSLPFTPSSLRRPKVCGNP